LSPAETTNRYRTITTPVFVVALSMRLSDAGGLLSLKPLAGAEDE